MVVKNDEPTPTGGLGRPRPASPGESSASGAGALTRRTRFDLAPLQVDSPTSLAPAQPIHWQPSRGAMVSHRPMNPQLRTMLDALGGPGPEYRAPLMYTGDPMSSLHRLRTDVISHYSGICRALGEPERRDLLEMPSGQGTAMASILDNYAPAPALPAAGSLMGMGDYVSSALYQHSPLMGSHLPGMGPGSSYWSHRAGQLYGGQGQAQARQYLPAPGSLLPMYSNTPSVRMSSYTTVSQPPIGEGLFMREESTLMYPPVGSTFDGRRSQSAAAASRPIDSLADFHYRRPKPLNFEGLDAGIGEQAVRRAQAARDQLDVFLQDYSKGANKPNPGQFYPGGRVSVY